MEDRCVFCEAIIPEGTQICPDCQKKYSTEERDDCPYGDCKGSRR